MKPVPRYIDTLGSLHEWLGVLLEEHPSLRDCGVFALDGDCLTAEHFMWCDDDGSDVPIAQATEVTIQTNERSYEAPPDVAALERREEEVRMAERDVLYSIDDIERITGVLSAAVRKRFQREIQELSNGSGT